MKKPIGILGGTFDPVHFGHLRIALEIYQQLQLQEVRFIPCQVPVFKQKTFATTEQRLKMLNLAIAEQTGFVIDDRELQRSTRSYMIETLTSLREEFDDMPLCLIIGSDLLAELPHWQRWQELINYAHIVVTTRPDYSINSTDPIADFITQHRIYEKHDLWQTIAGKIWLAAVTPLAISSTEIRQQIANGLNPRYLLPENVWHYIQSEKIYD